MGRNSDSKLAAERGTARDMRLKNVLASLLAVTLSLTAPLTSLAAGDLDDSAQGNNQAGTITGAGGDFSANILNDYTSGKIGFRLTLVDRKDPTKILSVDDNGNPKVVDFLYVTAPTFVTQVSGGYYSALLPEYTYLSPKTYSNLVTQSSGEISYERVYYDELQAKFTEKPIVPWLKHNGSSYISTGNEFVNWCTTNNLGQPATGDNGTLFCIGNGSLVMSVLREDGIPDNMKADATKQSSKGKRSYVSSTKSSDTIQSELDRLVSDVQKSATSTNYNNYILELGVLNNQMLSSSVSEFLAGKLQEEEVNAKLNYTSNKIAEAAEALSQVSGQSSLAIKTSLVERANENLVGGVYDDPVIATAVAGWYNSMLGAQNTVSAAEGNYFTFAQSSHMMQLLSWNTDGKYKLQTESMRTGEAKDITEATEDWILLVEPIIWLTIFPNGHTNYVVHTKMYGTITNFVQAFMSDPALAGYRDSKFFNWKAVNQPVWWALSVPTTAENNGYAFVWDTDEEIAQGANSAASTLAFRAPTKVGSYRSFSDLYKSMQEVSGNITQNGVTRSYARTVEGWGVNFYSKDQLVNDIQQTLNLSDDSSSSNSSKPNPVKVVKWYVVNNQDETGKVTSQTVTAIKTGTLDRNKEIGIVNEPGPTADAYFQVEAWATGKDENAIPNTSDLTETYEDYISKAPGTLGGYTPVIIDLSDKPSEKTVYIKLVVTPSKTTGDSDVTVVKIKEPSDGSTPLVETSTTTNTGTYDSTEDGWVYQQDIQTPDPKKDVTNWNEVPTTGTPGTNPMIPINQDTQTIYIRYKQADAEPVPAGAITLHQNEISYAYELRDLSESKELAGIQQYFKSEYDYGRKYCSGGHSCSNDDCNSNHKCASRASVITDSGYTLSVTSSNTSPNFILDYAQSGAWSVSGTLSIRGGNTSVLRPNASFILFRDRTKDLITLYPGKNNSTKSLLAQMGITSEAYEPQTRRVATTGSGKFLNTFRTNFSEGPGFDNTLSWSWNGSRGCYESGSWNGNYNSGRNLANLNSTYSKENNVETRYELGQVNTANEKPSDSIDQTFTNVFANNQNSEVAQDGKIEFYPYIRMVLNDKSNGNESVYVTSTNLSSLPAFTKIEAGVWKNGEVDSDSSNGKNPEPNVELTSTQWSTHQSSLTFMKDNGVNDKNSVLPGGAIFDIEMNPPKSSEIKWTGPSDDKPTTSTKLGYRIWTTCIDDSLTGALAGSSTAPSLSDARGQVDAFDQSIKDAVAQYGLVQAVAMGITDYDGYLKKFIGDSAWQYAYNGAEWFNITLSTDSKYYLKLVEPNSNSSGNLNTSVSNFGIHDATRQEIVYTIKSDTEGNVFVYKGSSLLAQINKTQGVETLLANAEVKRVDDATKAVTNFVKALDRNLGSDRNSNRWYNEAFDGITVLYTYLSYDIGLGDGSTGVISGEAKSVGTRTAVQDTYLSGVLENKSDLYNFTDDTENKVRSTMMLTGQISNGQIHEPSGDLGSLTTKNGTTMQITLSNMETFAYTKMYYIPNANVTDLN